MKNFRESLKEELNNPEFQKEWNALDTEFRQIRQTLDYRANDDIVISRMSRIGAGSPKAKIFTSRKNGL